MKSTIWKSTFREIKQSFGRFAAILAIVALGVGLFAGLKITQTAMIKTVTEYFKETDFYDYRLMSTVGFSKEDVEVFRQQEDVKAAEGSVSFDILCSESGGNEKVLKAYSLPEEVNRITVVEGRLPEKENECVVDANLYGSSMIGKKITLSEQNDEGDLERFTYREYEITGLVQSPLYIQFERGTTSLGSGKIAGFMYLMPEGFETDDYTEIYVKFTDEFPLYSEAYEDYLDGKTDSWESLTQEVTETRYKTVVEDAKKELEDGKAELAEKKADAKKELAEAKEKLDEAEAELADGEKQLKEAREKLESAPAEIEEKEKELEEAEALLTEKESQLDQGEIALGIGYSMGMGQLSEALNSMGNILGSSSDGENGGSSIFGSLGADGSSAGNSETDSSISGADGSSAGSTGTDSDILGSLGADSSMFGDLASGNINMEEALAQISSLKRQIADGRVQIAEAKQQIKEGKSAIAAAKQQLEDGEKELKEKEKEFEEGKAEYEKGRKEYNEARETFEKEVAEAEEKIADGEETLAELEEPDSYVLGRNTNVGYVCFESDSGIVDGIANVFPVFFFLVAALVCMTTMNRMVEEQRTQIGVLKALGYSQWSIMAKYIFYSGSAALLGCLIGFFGGIIAFPRVIWYAYQMMYRVDSLAFVFDWKLALISLAGAMLCSVGVTYISCRYELSEAAAELMRPKAPKAGKRVFLEYLPFLWKRLKFLQKVSLRNIFRYKKRFFMMILGISGCSALLVTGFGVRDSVTNVANQQYTEIQLFDVSVTCQKPVDAAMEQELKAMMPEKISAYGFAMETTVDLEVDGEIKSISLVAAEDAETMEPFLNLHTQKDEPISYPGKGEAVISHKIAKTYDVKVGDEILLRDENRKELRVTVSGIFENFVYDYVYVTAETYEAQMGEAPGYKTVYINAAEGQDAHLLGTSLMNMKNAVTVSVNQDFLERFSSMMQSMNLIVFVIILCAAGLAFIVLYNLTNINITERMREIATIKVLGFYEKETSSYVFRENLILTFLGALLGLILGKLLHAFVMGQIKVDAVTFDVQVLPVSYLYSVVLTLVFALLVNQMMKKKIDNISMTESLKSVD